MYQQRERTRREITDKMDALEQIVELEGQIEHISTTLACIGDMEAWEAKEYLNVALDYVTRLHRLKLHVEANKEVFCN